MRLCMREKFFKNFGQNETKKKIKKKSFWIKKNPFRLILMGLVGVIQFYKLIN
jgi:hypothetical protein